MFCGGSAVVDSTSAKGRVWECKLVFRVESLVELVYTSVMVVVDVSVCTWVDSVVCVGEGSKCNDSLSKSRSSRSASHSSCTMRLLCRRTRIE